MTHSSGRSRPGSRARSGEKRTRRRVSSNETDGVVHRFGHEENHVVRFLGDEVSEDGAGGIDGEGDAEGAGVVPVDPDGLFGRGADHAVEGVNDAPVVGIGSGVPRHHVGVAVDGPIDDEKHLILRIPDGLSWPIDFVSSISTIQGAIRSGCRCRRFGSFDERNKRANAE